MLKPRIVHVKYMWDQPAHRSVCSHYETHLKCYTCPGHCCIKRPSVFSKRQARWWGEDRRCRECIAGTEAAREAAAAEVPEQAAADSAEQTAETVGEAAGAAAEHRAAEQVAEQAVAEQAAEQPVVEQTAAKQAAEKAAEAAATEQASPGVLKFVVLNYF